MVVVPVLHRTDRLSGAPSSSTADRVTFPNDGTPIGLLLVLTVPRLGPPSGTPTDRVAGPIAPLVFV